MARYIDYTSNYVTTGSNTVKWMLFVDGRDSPLDIDENSLPAEIRHLYSSDWYIARSLAEAEELIYMYGMPNFLSVSDTELGYSVIDMIIDINMGIHAHPHFSHCTLDSSFAYYIHDGVGEDTMFNDYLKDKVWR